MRYFTAFLLVFLYFIPSLQAQEKQYEDLWVLYIDEEYEKLEKKATAMTENDKTRKDAMPYLFASMANYEMSKDEKYAEEYPKAFKDACKYAARWRKKDKEDQYVYDNKDYISELREGAMEEAEGYLEDGSYSKAKSLYKYMSEFGPEDPGSWLIYALVQKKLNDFSGHTESLGIFEETFAANSANLDKVSMRLLKYSLIRYSEDLYREGKKSDAKAMISKGKDLFVDDSEFKIVFEDMSR